MGEWDCTVCGLVYDGAEPPLMCPDCGASKDKFVYYALEDDDAWAEELHELITFNRDRLQEEEGEGETS